MASPNEFLQSIKEIEGITFQERMKAFSMLMHEFQYQNPSQEDVNKVCQAFKPETRLEHVFKVEFLLRFQKAYELLEVLSCQNIELIRRVLRCKWFYQYFENLTADFFILEVLNKISYNTRFNLLKGLGKHFKNPAKADEFFEATLKNYGLSSARHLVPCCSNEKTLDVVGRFGIQVYDHEVLSKVKRDHAFLEKYCGIMESLDLSPGYDFNKSLTYLGVNHFNSFYILLKKYKMRVNPNKAITSKILQLRSKEFISDPNHFVSIMDMQLALKFVKKKGLLSEFFLNLFPKKFEDFGYRFSNYRRDSDIKRKKMKWNNDNSLRYALYSLPKKERYPLLSSSFTKAYGKDILDCENSILLNLMDFLDPEEISRCVSRQEDVYDWMKFMPIVQSLPYYLDKVHITSDIYERGTHLVMLVETCAFNNDLNALLTVLKHFTRSHLNDDFSNRSRFMDSVKEKFKLEELPMEHWEEIYKIFIIFVKNNERYYKGKKILEAYIRVLLSKDRPIKDPIINLIKIQNYENSYNILKDKSDYEKKCLNLTGYVLSEVHKEESKLKKGKLQYLKSILKWNVRHPSDRYPANSVRSLVEVLREEVSSKEHNRFALDVLVLISEDLPYLEEFKLEDLIDEHVKTRINRQSTLITMLKKNPLEALEYLHWFHELRSYELPPLLYLVSKLDHLDIPQKIIQSCMDNTYSRDNSLFILSFLLKCSELESLVAQGLNVEDPEAQASFQNKVLILSESLQYTLPQKEAMLLSIKILDKLIRSRVFNALYRLIMYVPEYKLHIIYESLAKREVSIRKHALQLIVRTSSMHSVISMLGRFGKTEKNKSMHKCIVKCTMKYFLNNPCEETWSLLVDNGKIIPQDDKESYHLFGRSSHVCVIYRPRFIEYAWSVLEVDNPHAQLERTRLMSDITEKIINLNPEFCMRILQNRFLADGFRAQDINNLALRYLSSAKDKELDLRLLRLFSICKKRKEEYWESDTICFRSKVKDFIDSVTSTSMYNGNLEIVKKVYEYYTKTFSRLDMYLLVLDVEVSIICLEVSGDINHLGALAKRILEHFHRVLEECRTDAILHNYVEIIKNNVFSNPVIDDVNDQLKFVEILRELCKSDVDYLLMLNLLIVFKDKSDPDCRRRLRKILGNLKGNTNFAVQAYISYCLQRS